MIELALLFLLYMNVKSIRKYMNTNDTRYVALIAVLLFIFFNLWLDAYSEILGEFIGQFKIAVNLMPIVIVVGVVHLEGLRKREEKERLKTRDFFSKYVSEKIVDRLLSGGRLDLGGEKHRVTVIFTDVRGFTSMSEKLDPHQVVEVLNGHFDIITEEIFKEEGTVLKYIGDAAMAVFNAPVRQEGHEAAAVRAAVRIQEKMRKYSLDAKKRYGIEFAIGVGINTGEVVVGNIGSQRYMDFTVIGDAVNTASRLNGVARAGEIAVSESTMAGAGKKIKFTGPEEVSVKGKTGSIMVYKVYY